jgi:SAM-dependent methyltransferase
MNPTDTPPLTTFDEYADAYEAALESGISVSGESKEYFAEGRIRWLSRCLKRLGLRADSVLDYGCGTGGATPLFFDVLGARSFLGLDVSQRSIAVARTAHGSARAAFALAQDSFPKGEFDLVFCNGVFHHIPPNERDGVVRRIVEALRPGGVFALWENNPLNPGTRIVMSRIPFDRDAILVWPHQARRLVRAAGLRVLRSDYLFIFPRLLKGLRFVEPALSRLPLGAQYQVLGRKMPCPAE